jgi:hypothetical protein
MRFIRKKHLRSWLVSALEIASKSLKIAASQSQELIHDQICGHWVDIYQNFAATVIKMDYDYMLSFFRCGVLGEQFTIVPYGEELRINSYDGEKPSIVKYDNKSHELVIGDLGHFIRDHEADNLQAMNENPCVLDEEFMPETGVETDNRLVVGMDGTSSRNKMDKEEYRRTFMVIPKIIDRKPIFVSHTTRDNLSKVARLLGEQNMNVSDFLENLAVHHLETYRDDILKWYLNTKY